MCASSGGVNYSMDPASLHPGSLIVFNSRVYLVRRIAGTIAQTLEGRDLDLNKADLTLYQFQRPGWVQPGVEVRHKEGSHVAEISAIQGSSVLYREVFKQPSNPQAAIYPLNSLSQAPLADFVASWTPIVAIGGHWVDLTGRGWVVESHLIAAALENEGSPQTVTLGSKDVLERNWLAVPKPGQMLAHASYVRKGDHLYETFDHNQTTRTFHAKGWLNPSLIVYHVPWGGAEGWSRSDPKEFRVSRFDREIDLDL